MRRMVPDMAGDGKNSYDPDETRKAWDSLEDGRSKPKAASSGPGPRRQNPARFAQWKAKVVFDDGVVPPLGRSQSPATAGITATPFKWVDLSKTPPRDWLYGDILLRKFISMTVAPGGVGKSSLVAVETLAQVTGKALLGEDAAGGTYGCGCGIWKTRMRRRRSGYWRQPSTTGLQKRTSGTGCSWTAGGISGLVIAEMRGTTPMIVRPVVSALVEQIQLRGIDVVVIDPFVSCHGVPENDNTAQDMVVKEWGG